MKAVIFDMDGVLAETERFHTRAKQRVLKDHGIVIDSEELEKKFAGTPSENMFEKLFDEKDVDVDPQKAADRKRNVYHELIEGNVEEIPGVKDLVKDLYERYPLVLASSSAPRNIRMILESTGLEKYFQEKISAKEKNIEGKPAPDIYLEAASRVDVEPKNCVAIEDSNNGVESADAAGMKVVGYEIENCHVDLKVDGFEELDIKRMEEL